MPLRWTPFVLMLSAMSWSLSAQSTQVTLPEGTPLPVRLPAHLPMRAGEPIRAELLYPVFIDNQLVLPEKTIVNGTVIALKPDRAARLRARLGGDFTPLRKPVVTFEFIVLPSGVQLPIRTGEAADGAPVYRLVLPPPRSGGLIARAWHALQQFAKDEVAVVTGPDKADRFEQFAFRQLPYHPQRIAKDTAWTVETAAPALLPQPPSFTPHEVAVSTPAVSDAVSDAVPTWTLQAYLTAPISSATSRAGQSIQAVVAEPIRSPEGNVTVPQGAVLTGVVTQARAARKFSRAGILRFSFNRLLIEGQQPRTVRTAIAGIDSAGDVPLEMDAEGQVKPKSQGKLVIPLILLSLAARPLDHDHDRENHTFGKDAVASNSLGLLGFLLGTAAQRQNLAAAIGYYGAALSIYQRIFSRGKEVAFPRDARVIIQTTATRATPMSQPAIRR